MGGLGHYRGVQFASSGRCFRWLAAIVVGVVVAMLPVGCQPALRGPYFGDDKLLRFGVDPHAEAREIEVSFERRGYARRLRLAAPHFTALGFMAAAGDRTAVRVVTLRGIALALDGEPAGAHTSEGSVSIGPAMAYGLLRPPLDGTHDADGDGFDEIFIHARRGPEACIRVYRVRDSGFVDPVVIRLPGPEAPALCVRTAEDGDGDGQVELRASWTLLGVPLPVQPTLPVVLVPDGHTYVMTSSPAHYRVEVATAEVELSEAMATGDAPWAYDLITELAALAGLSGASTEAQCAALTAAFDKLPRALRRPEWERGLVARFERGLFAFSIGADPSEVPEGVDGGMPPDR